MIHAILEVDLTVPRDLIRHYRATSGDTLSFTGYLSHCLATAVDSNKHTHAYRDWRNRLILIDGVDVSTPLVGIVDRPILTPGGLEEREHLCLTVSFDHDIIGGAPAARFLQRFKEIIEEGKSLQRLASQPLAGADPSR